MSSGLLSSGLSPHELRCHMDNLRATKPPYTCPIANCDRVYKSFSGIQSHLSKVKHEGSAGGDRGAEEVGSVVAHPDSRNDDAGAGCSGTRPGQQMSWTQAQKIIDVDVTGKIMRLNIFEPIPITFVHGGEISKGEEKKPEMVPVPRAVFRELKEFEPMKMDSFPSTYIRYIEKTAEELDEEIEYDMDEEDDAWLELINEARLREGWPRVSEATFEYVLNRLEKDSYFKTTAVVGPGHEGDCVTGSGGRMPHFEPEDDTVCCVCGDGECDNANAILFCDMCNLAVHQECYGVPYIPEGQWLCRRCQLSPSRGAECRLCPNKGGAFKQTSDNGWAHVVCALWVPEVQFANTVFLEPIEGFDRIPPARWKLTCYICKQKARGACIQCHKPSCYTAFHVTCAQQAGLHMKMETVNDARSPDGGISVRKSAFCDVHAPSNGGDSAASADERGKKNGYDSERKSRQSEPPSVTPKFDMRKARKLLSQKRNLSPTVSVPVMPRRKLDLLLQQLRFAGKQEFLERILRYWTLKRRSRFGVPLLRRLQVTHHASRMEKERIRNRELQDQYNNWRQLRQDLEKARLLMELVRKRERKKKENVQVASEAWESFLWEPRRFLIELIDQLEAFDEKRVFTQPVDDEEVPGYSRIIKSPMDLSTMRQKAEQFEYKDFAHMEKDFDLMMANCMKFNVQNEYYKSYGTKFKKQALEILRPASQVYAQLKECRPPLVADLKRHSFQGDIASEQTPDVAGSSSAQTKKPPPKKQKVSAATKPKISNSEESFGDMPTLSACESPAQAKEKGKSNQKTGSNKTASSKKPKTEPASTPSTAKTPKKKSQKTPNTTKKLATSNDSKKPATPATTPRAPKKKQQKTVATASNSGRNKKSVDDEEDATPLAMLGQMGPPTKNSECDKNGTPSETAETARPSFIRFREDRKSPNSSAVESEMEPASGDEGGYLRKKSSMPSSSSGGQLIDDVGVNQLNLEHLDFVWARVDGKPRMPGVVIFPDVEYGPQATVRYIPPPEVLNQKAENAFLVMLFDEDQSWLWLKREALLMLGLESETDERQVSEAGPAKNMVIQAYARALKARRLVMGEDVSADDADESGPPVIDEYRSSGEDSDGGTSDFKRRSSRGGRTKADSESSN